MVSEFQSIFQRLPYGAIIVDDTGVVVDINQKCMDMFPTMTIGTIGVSVFEILGRLFGSSLNNVDQALKDALRSPGEVPQSGRKSLEMSKTSVGSCDHIDLRFGRVDDRYFYLAFLPDDEDEEPAIERYDPWLSAIFDTLLNMGDAGIFIVGTGGVITRLNDLARQCITPPERDPFEVSGKALSDVLVLRQNDHIVDLSRWIEQTLKAKRRREFSVGLVLELPDGSEEAARVTIAPIASEQGGDDARAVISVELTGTEEQVRRDLRDLQHAEDICRAARGISHELTNSTTAIMAQLDRLQRVLLVEHIAGEDVRQIRSAARKVQRLGVQLERFAWRNTDVTDVGVTGPLSVARVDEIIHDTVSLAVSGTGIRTTFSFDTGIPSVNIPAHELTQALFNILVNAVDAMSEGGTLRTEVRYQKERRSVSIVVRDEGTGMDPRLLQDAFRPYFSTKPHGIGMGLTVSRSIVESYGGTLVLETEPGFGTTARMTLPVAHWDDKEIVFDRADHMTAPVDLEHVRVLLVEDDPLVRRSMEMMIRNLGCDVTAVHSGERAIEVFQTEQNSHRSYGVLVTDLAMPGRVDGIQLLRRLREYVPDLPAVLSSGALHRDSAGGYRDAGFQFVLRKPFGQTEMRAALSAALGPHRRYA